MTSGDAERLLQGAWIADLPLKTRARLASAARLRELKDGEAVFRAGDPPDGLFGVIDGQVRLILHSAAGQPLLNHLAEAGDWFGEISTLDRQPRLNEAICSGPTRIAHVRQDEAERLMREEPEILRALATLAARHHRAAVAFAARALMQPLGAQVAYALLSLARKARRRDGSGRLYVRQEDVASMLGVSRQAVAVQLRSLRDRGAIALGYGAIEVRDQARLEAAAALHDGPAQLTRR
ncbi:Crp/Fnr family transcriptional regulator [Phenylobacterium sp. VNQ135]|uniref:Crp/Fnr family transcriptional regulator n=1 Tax=Phenylobacterium sp. VNQ135 TaxID=3400922 RepID=UPI003C0CD9F4